MTLSKVKATQVICVHTLLSTSLLLAAAAAVMQLGQTGALALAVALVDTSQLL
jgi:hypothetical protein